MSPVLIFIPFLDGLPPVFAITPLQAEELASELPFHPDRKIRSTLCGMDSAMSFSWVFCPPQAQVCIEKQARCMQLSTPLWLTSTWPMRFSSEGWQVLSVFPPIRIFMLTALGLLPKEANEGGGAFHPCRGGGGLVSMTGLTRTNSTFITSQLIR